MHARTNAFEGSSAKIPSLPDSARKMRRIMLVDVHRTVFAATGFTFKSAFLYSTADTVQHNAEPKAASSPSLIICSHGALIGLKQRFT
jgi:hypothetical protein